jgi:predicted NUDIX family phosphoesterase
VSLVETEQVLVVPTAEFHRLGYFQGFSREVDRYLPELLESHQLRYLPRGEMEDDPNFKQLIPYVVFRHRTDNQVSLFQYCRGKGQGETRLRAKRSVGVGGHISTLDSTTGATGTGVYEEGLRRELNEEVEIQSGYSTSCIGLINDDETEVGKVHLGIVHIYDIEKPVITPREVDILDARFQSLEEIRSDLEQFESWSQIVVQNLFS